MLYLIIWSAFALVITLPCAFALRDRLASHHRKDRGRDAGLKELPQ